MPDKFLAIVSTIAARVGLRAGRDGGNWHIIFEESFQQGSLVITFPDYFVFITVSMLKLRSAIGDGWTHGLDYG